MYITKKKTTYIKLTLSVLLLSLFCANLKKLQGLLFKPKKINIFFSCHLHQDTKNKIYEELTKNLYVIENPKLYQNIKQNFPELENITIQNNCLSTDIYIKSSQPFINLISSKDSTNKFILTSSANISNSENFTENSIKNLFNLYFANEFDKNNKDLTFFALNIDVKLYENYIITWYSPTKITLKSLDCNNLEIISDVKSINDINKINWAIKIYQNKMLKNKTLKVDIRFKDMLICRAS